MSALLQKEAERRRIRYLVPVVFGVEFGSLWWVDDRIWNREIPEFREPKAGLRVHPGVSIARMPEGIIPETYPLIFGTSGEHGPVRVKGISPHDERTTSFGVLAPAWLEAGEFIVSVSKRNRDVPVARQNCHKPLLDPEEEEALDEFVNGAI